MLIFGKVVWDKQVDTSTEGTFIYTGTVNGYSGKIRLTLNIKGVSMGNINRKYNKTDAEKLEEILGL